MNKDFEELKEKVITENKENKYKNQVMEKFCKKNNSFIEFSDEKIYEHLGKTLFMEFNNDIMEITNQLINEKENEKLFFKDWLDDYYINFIHETFNKLNISCYDDLENLSVILDDIHFLLNKAKEKEFEKKKIIIHEVPFKLKRKLKTYNLIIGKENMIRKLIDNHLPKSVKKSMDNWAASSMFSRPYYKREIAKKEDKSELVKPIMFLENHTNWNRNKNRLNLNKEVIM